MRRYLEEKITEFGIADNVRLLGTIPHERMSLFENAMDVLILPSLAEGRPNVVLEAMACQRPVVATAVSGTPELVEDKKTGYLIPPSDTNSIRDKLSAILSDPKKGEQMGKAGKERIDDLGLSWKNHAEKTIKVYKEVTEV